MTTKNTVLVVDDQPNIVELNRMYLESAGYRVVAARTGDEALACLSAVVPHPRTARPGGA
jgi:CheY-like chemotaxis protein